MKNNHIANKWIYDRTKCFLPQIVVISVLNILIVSVYICLAKASQNVIDNALNSDKNTLLIGSIILFGLIFIQIVLNAIVSILTTNTSTKMNISLRNHMFTNLMKKKYVDISEYHSGDLLNRFSSDVDVIVNGTVGLIPSVISMLTKIIAGVVAICIQNYIFAFIVLGMGFVIPLIGRLISKKYKEIHKKVQETEGVSRSFLQESFVNIIVIKTLSGERSFFLKLNEYMHENRKQRIKNNTFSVIIYSLLSLLFSFGYYGVLVWGAAQVAKELMTFGTLVYFLQLISMLRSPLQNISGILPRHYATVASAERLLELENLKNEKKDTYNIKSAQTFKSITAENLTFAYTNEIVLKNNNFTIDRNTITAVVGRSGSGKSTLFKLLLGLYAPTAGSIKFDDQTPIDETTRQMFSYVPQGNMVISGTIRENISLCSDNVKDEDIIKAAKASVIYDDIMSLPNKFDTLISEHGLGLSEGQIQRIAIARALLFDSPIILLDEATSALDEATEAQLLKNIKEFKNKTIIFITHRGSSLEICDNILQIEGGTFTLKQKGKNTIS